MPSGNVHNNKVHCPSCGESDYKIYRRESSLDDAVLCLASCLKCDATFNFSLDRFGNPIPVCEDNSPQLPFEEHD